MNKKIFFIYGPPNSGKSLFISMVMAKVPAVQRVSIADPVLNAVRTLGWTGGSDNKGQEFISSVKKAALAYNDFLFKRLKEKIFSSDSEVVFIILREDEPEAEIAKYLEISPLKVSVCHGDGDFIVNNSDYMYMSQRVDDFMREYL